jgi:TolB-like protein/DNA-binding winged helix-turn-helix (wHTH) protein/Tfp pilus assembly protein PilF
MSQGNKELYQFDKFRLDISERILWRDDERMPLSEKAFETLCVLVRRPNRLISKEELLNEVWANTVVEENNLDKNISLLRQLLGERAGIGKFIETVRGHGYRFVVEVREISDKGELRRDGDISTSEPPLILAELSGSNEVVKTLLQADEPGNSDRGKTQQQQHTAETLFVAPDSELSADNKALSKPPFVPHQRRWSMALAVCSFLIVGALAVYFWRTKALPALPTQIKTIAVLPFKPLIAENRNEALEMGMTETLISKLSSSQEVIVRPLSSVRKYSTLEQNSLTAGRELNVEAILDGSIQTSGDRVRISARLLQAIDGKQLWSGQFDEKFTDIFAVQDSISERVAAALKIRLRGKDKNHYTINVEAYQLYMKGRFHLIKATRPDTDTSISYFQQAIVADPLYALAYAGIADGYRGRAVGGEQPSTNSMLKARAAANKAIEIDDSLAEAHTSVGLVIYWYDWDWKAAEMHHQRAIELNPNSADALQFYAHLLSTTGRHSEALTKIKRARELDPLNLRINALEGLFLLHAGQTDEAITALQKTLELDSNHRLANMFAARAYIEKGMFTEAINATRKVSKLSAMSSEPIAYGAYALAKSGDVSQARAALDDLLKQSASRYVPPYNIALIYSGLGEQEKALDYLEMGYKQKDVRMVFLKVEQKWNNLHSAPRFIDLIKRMQLEQ